jgi:hypothetical protein
MESDSCSHRAQRRGSLYAGSVDGKLQKRVMDNGSNSVLARGRLFFVREGNLVSQPFDPAKLALSGTVTPVADHVEYFKVRALGNFSVTETKLVYVSEASGRSEIAVHDRGGRIAILLAYESEESAPLARRRPQIAHHLGNDEGASGGHRDQKVFSRRAANFQATAGIDRCTAQWAERR